MPLMHHTESETSPRSIPLRSEVPLSDTWNLTPLYLNADAWEENFTKLQADYGEISNFRGKVAESALALRDALEFEKSIDLRTERLSQYAALRVAENAADDASLSREARFDSLRVKIGEAFSFLVPEIQEIPDENFDRYLADRVLIDWVIPLKEDPPLESAHLERQRRATAGAGLLGVAGVSRDFLAAYQCGHEVWLCPRSERTGTRTDAKFFFLVSPAAGT